jgi:hypothetical protein
MCENYDIYEKVMKNVPSTITEIIARESFKYIAG